MRSHSRQKPDAERAPEPVEGAATPVSALASFVSTRVMAPAPQPLSFGHQRGELVDDGLHRPVAGVDHHGVVGLGQRRVGAAAVEVVASRRWPPPPRPAPGRALLLVAAGGAHLGRGRQVELERRVGEHDRADVAALDHPAAARRGPRPLLAAQLVAHRRVRRHRAHRAVHLGRADGLGDVVAVDVTTGSPTSMRHRARGRPRPPRSAVSTSTAGAAPPP